MGQFNSLSYATKLVNAGVPRPQAEVYAQALQEVVDQEHGQYATKADFIVLSHEVKTQIDQLKATTIRLEDKTDRLEHKTSQFEIKITADIANLQCSMETKIDECKREFSGLRADVAVLTNSHKYVLWVGGGLATLCLGVFGLCISTLLANL